nr:hypothetical protein [Trichocoleus desertorum]
MPRTNNLVTLVAEIGQVRSLSDFCMLSSVGVIVERAIALSVSCL